MGVTQTRRLSADDWAQAALAAIADGGLAAVAVEPIAARLGATKGSFYWHFANREALVDAALRRWEAASTDEVIEAAQTEPDPTTRLRRLFTHVVEAASRDRTEVALLATADHPQVAPVLQQVTERRVGYVSALFAEIGFPPEVARRRGVLAFSAYLGHIQLAHAAPAVLPSSAADRRAHLDEALQALLHGAPH